MEYRVGYVGDLGRFFGRDDIGIEFVNISRIVGE